MFALGTPKEQSFSRNQYIGYGLDDLPALDRRQPDTKDTPATRDTISSNKNVKLNNNNNNGNNLVYDMENDSNGNGGNNIWDEIKQQGLSDTRSLQNGRYNFDLKNENNNRFNGYDTARKGSTGNEGESEKQNEFDSLEEYEKYLQRRGYLP